MIFLIRMFSTISFLLTLPLILVLGIYQIWRYNVKSFDYMPKPEFKEKELSH